MFIYSSTKMLFIQFTINYFNPTEQVLNDINQ